MGPRLLGYRTRIFDGVFEGILEREVDIIVCGEKWDLFCGVVAGAAWPCLIEWRMMGDHAATLRPASGPYLIHELTLTLDYAVVWTTMRGLR